MASYYASARSNYFKVRDNRAFKAWLTTIPDLRYIEHDVDKNLVGFLCDADGGFPCDKSVMTNSKMGNPVEEYVELDIITELWPHLQEGEVAIIMESGAEKLRYVVGWAKAVNWLGKTKTVDLTHIYKEAKKLGGNNTKITAAEY